eukprot:6175256-Pleurochrysis_carterae.AAC.2
MATCERCSLVSVKVYVPVIYSPRRGLKRRAAQPQRRSDGSATLRLAAQPLCSDERDRRGALSSSMLSSTQH